MPTAAIAAKNANKSSEKPTNVQSTRETVESIVVAFILAFLFRAFVAEAFVIPTGSMAPTLMGAHKDLICEHCGEQFQVGASHEYSSETGGLTNSVTVAGTCSACRGTNAYDLRGNANHATFSGDRILVSKFDYVLSKPKRWDVFVFKYPTEARMNYIKRLIGMPGEQLLIQGGDIYVKTDAEWEIARKPLGKIRAMRQVVSDTDHRAEVLIEKGWPSLWQPLESNQGWSVENNSESWSAKLSPTSEASLLRYYHKVVPNENWAEILDGGDLPTIEKQQSELITDFLAYNSTLATRRMDVYDKKGKLRENITTDSTAYSQNGRWITRGMASALVNRGFHWVGDLIGDFEVEIESESGKLVVDLVEFGVHYSCQIDVETGAATLTAWDATGEIDAFDGSTTLKGETRIRGNGSHRIEFANVDDQIVLWVDRKAVKFDKPATFDSRKYRNGTTRRPYWTEADPLDAAPIGIGGQSLEMTVTRAGVFRDIYYIAPQSSGEFCDYNLNRSGVILASLPTSAATRSYASTLEAILAVYANPQWWEQTDLFNLRGERHFKLDEGQYFPMGDNSAQSSDARAWTGQHYVEEKFLLGKALLVFWPHYWNRPIPFTPNFARMGLIR